MTDVPLTPYIFGIIFFIITYILITNPCYTFFVSQCVDETWARYTIAILIGGLVFITIAYVMKKEGEIVPQ
jgi:hypothetical protein